MTRASAIAFLNGLFIGLVVLGISAQHAGSVVGLGLALVYALSASASMVLFLLSRQRLGRQGAVASAHAWVGWQCLGVLLTVYLWPLL